MLPIDLRLFSNELLRLTRLLLLLLFPYLLFLEPLLCFLAMFEGIISFFQNTLFACFRRRAVIDYGQLPSLRLLRNFLLFCLLVGMLSYLLLGNHCLFLELPSFRTKFINLLFLPGDLHLNFSKLLFALNHFLLGSIGSGSGIVSLLQHGFQR